MARQLYDVLRNTMTKHDPQLLAELCRETDHLSGDLAEVGVWRGASARVILEQTTHGLLYLYDTFCGMPAEVCEGEYHKAGSWGNTSQAIVLQWLGELATRAVLCPGVFPQTASHEGPFRFVHIDCDQYLSTRAALEWFAPRLQEGGVILLDDYGCSTTPGARRAADEYVKASGGRYAVEARRYRGILRATEASVCS